MPSSDRHAGLAGPLEESVPGKLLRPAWVSVATRLIHRSVPEAVPPDTRSAVSLLQPPPTLDGFHKVRRS